MAVGCGDPHHIVGSALLRPRGLPFRLQHMRLGVGLHAMQLSHHFDTDGEELDERPRHPDVWGGCGPQSAN